MLGRDVTQKNEPMHQIVKFIDNFQTKSDGLKGDSFNFGQKLL